MDSRERNGKIKKMSDYFKMLIIMNGYAQIEVMPGSHRMKCRRSELFFLLWEAHHFSRLIETAVLTGFRQMCRGDFLAVFQVGNGPCHPQYAVV